MIDLVNGSLMLKGRVESITRWEVWFLGPQGLFATRQEALDHVEDPRYIIPVPVAIAGDLFEVAMR